MALFFRFGFVTYAKMEGVDDCLASGPHTIDGRVVDVKRAVPKDSSHGEDGESPKNKKVSFMYVCLVCFW